MQFYLNGFRTGDPCVQQAAENVQHRPTDVVDVLIVGCGPAGLTLAAQLAQFPDIHTRIVDQKSGPLEVGQADGVACRSIEMFEAFGFSEKVL
ncbi:MAG: FAD-dependent monooxygenase, partial [Rhodobacteraceae bacterium]|nr:FAD-dependent monooxygenase [Paracoccaceae bacterium]